MRQEYKRLVNDEEKVKEQESNVDNYDKTKKEQQKGIHLFKKTYQQIIHLYNLINIENIMLPLLKLFLIIPFISTSLNLYIVFQFSYLFKIIFLIIFIKNIVNKFTFAKLTFVYLENENNIIKYILVIFDMENIYLMIKYPNCLADLLKDRIKLLLDVGLFAQQQLMYFNFFQASKFEDLAPIFFQVFYTQILITLIIQNYSEMYPHSNNKTLQNWLCNRNFAISILHGCTFYQLMMLNVQALGYFMYLVVLSQIFQMILSSKKINTLSPLYFHIVNDIPFIQENFIKPYLLKWGYVRLTNGILICIIQKIIIISLTILGMIYLEFYHSYSTFAFTIFYLFLSILSLLILQKRYIQQRNLIYGQQPQLIEVNSEKEFKELLNVGATQDSQKYSNLQVINVTEENIQTKDKIHLLFYCFQKSYIFFKDINFQRFTLENKLFQSVIINNTLDLHNLDFMNQSILNNIPSIIVVNKQRFQNEDIYQKLVQNEIVLQITETQNDNCPSLQTYKKYSKEIQSVITQIQAFNRIIRYYILNNPQQAYFDLYD